ncbi:MAG: hypothetical protein ABW252_17840 [Polyangiales bacterium]
MSTRFISLLALATLLHVGCGDDGDDSSRDDDTRTSSGASTSSPGSSSAGSGRAASIEECVNACTGDADTCSVGCDDNGCRAGCDSDFSNCSEQCSEIR